MFKIDLENEQSLDLVKNWFGKKICNGHKNYAKQNWNISRTIARKEPKLKSFLLKPIKNMD
jgi:hypothetical protein